jgi:parallel beta helix pectate lyase-like protein
MVLDGSKTGRVGHRRSYLQFVIPYARLTGLAFYVVLLLLVSAAVASTCDSSIYPCAPANTRIVTVAADGSGNYANLQDALTAAQPGDTIQVKNGTYAYTGVSGLCGNSGEFCIAASGTQDQPIAIINHPGDNPQLKSQLTVWGAWILIQGLEITQTGNGITAYYDNNSKSGQHAQHLTLRGNHVHDAGYMGFYSNSVSYMLVEQNTFQNNGLGPGNCDFTAGGTPQDLAYAHCHGIYMANYEGAPASTAVIIRRNKFLNNTGSGVQNRMDGPRTTSLLIENNLFVSNQSGINYSDADNGVIRNNTIVQFGYSKPNRADKRCIMINHNFGNIFANNVCYSTLIPPYTIAGADTLYPIYSVGPDSTTGNVWSHNAFYVKDGTYWQWGGKMQLFLKSYKVVTKDNGGILTSVLPLNDGNGSQAGWVNPDGLNGNYHLLPTSPLRGRGDPAYCATEDFDGKPRSGSCDIGAFAFGVTPISSTRERPGT